MIITFRRLFLLTSILLAASPALAAAQLPPLDSLASRLAAMTAVSGYERAMTDSLLALLPSATRDRAGDVVLTLGSGEPRSLIACPIDEPGFVVGAIRPDGYLTLRRAGPPPGPLADQQFEGQQVTVFGRKGPVPGIVGVRSTHLARGRSTGDAPFTFDDAFVDIGADSAAQAAQIGIEVLAPVARTKVPHRYGDSLLAAPVAGRRAACAALLRAAAATRPGRGSVVVAFLVEQSFTRRGLHTVARTRGPFADGLLLEAAAGPESSSHPENLDAALPRSEVLGIGVRYAGTPVETVSLEEARRLEQKLRMRIGGPQ
jgi:putative aminopeptidase FrvX